MLYGWLLILAGTLNLLAALSPNPWQWYHRRTRPVADLLGRTGARIFFLALSTGLILSGLYLLRN